LGRYALVRYALGIGRWSMSLVIISFKLGYPILNYYVPPAIKDRLHTCPPQARILSYTGFHFDFYWLNSFSFLLKETGWIK